MFGWSIVSPKCLMQVQETGVGPVGVARRHAVGWDEGGGMFTRPPPSGKSALALATGTAGGN